MLNFTSFPKFEFGTWSIFLIRQLRDMCDFWTWKSVSNQAAYYIDWRGPPSFYEFLPDWKSQLPTMNQMSGANYYLTYIVQHHISWHELGIIKAGTESNTGLTPALQSKNKMLALGLLSTGSCFDCCPCKNLQDAVQHEQHGSFAHVFAIDLYISLQILT